MNKTRLLAKVFRDMADAYEEFADVEENDELNEQQKEEALERITGKIVVNALKIEKLK